MSDSDDAEPLSRRVKRRRTFSRSALISDEENVVNDGEGSMNQSSPGMFESKEDLNAMIAELGVKLIAKKRENEHQASAAELENNRLRSILSNLEHEIHEVEEILFRKRNELDLGQTELLSLGPEHESSKAAIAAKEKMLAQATTEVQEFEKVANELPTLLHRAEFESKDIIIMTMLRSWHQNIRQKYFTTDEVELPKAAGIGPRTVQKLDKNTKKKLSRVLNDLKTHESHSTFAHPVTEIIAPGYFDKIKQPMDLSTIRRKLALDDYITLSDFRDDVRLMFENCCKYNGDSSPVTHAGIRLWQQMRHLMEKYGLESR